MPDLSRTTISATQASALFNASKYTTRWMLYQYLKGLDAPKDTDNRMESGNYLEDGVLRWAADKFGLVKMVPNRNENGEQAYFTRGLLGCHRDADIFDPNKGWGALETKMVSDYRVWKEEWGGGDTPPKMHEIQLQTQMYVGDGLVPFTHGKIVAFVGGDLVPFDREPIPELWEALEKEAADLFEDVKLGNEPNPFGAEIESPLLNKYFPPKVGKVLDLSQIVDSEDQDVIAENLRRLAVLDWARAMKLHGEHQLFHKKAYDEAKAKLRGLALDAERVLLPYGANVSITVSERKAFSVKASTSVGVKPYIPDNLPDTLIVPGVNEEDRPI